MIYSIFPTQTAWISSGSNLVTGVTEKDQNFGKDEILELKKFYYNNSLNHYTRVLVSFAGTDFTNLSASVAAGTIPSNASYYLKLYEAEGNSDLSEEYTLAVLPISESWDEGVGRFGDSPKVTNGVSWKYRSNKTGASAVTWSNAGVTTLVVSSSLQTFSKQVPDVDIDVTNMTNMWYKNEAGNYGLLLRFSGSQETDETTFGHLNFFSSNTNTIYAPKLEVRWDDSSFDSDTTGSLISLDVTGSVDNYLYMKGLKESYKEGDRVKFRVGARKRYIQKTFNTSVQTVTGSYIPAGSGSYAIKDVATDEFIIPFSAYTTMSCDTTSNYFTQWLDGFYPDRVYKIIYKLKYDDGQEQIFDNNFEFKVKR